MTARKPCPSCAAWEARYDQLLAAFIARTQPVERQPITTSAPVVPPPPDVEAVVEGKIAAEYVQRLADDLQKSTGAPRAHCETEARRLLATTGVHLSDPT